MPEDMESHFEFPNFTTPIPGTLREVLYNDITPRDKISFNGSGMTKLKVEGLFMIMETGMEVAQYYTFLNYGRPSP